MFNIKDGYNHREENSHHNDIGFEDEWQKEVYQQAQILMMDNDFKSVLDIGCGSGYKLMRFLSEYNTTGIEVEPALSYLVRAYPDRVWIHANYELLHKVDLVILSDVIEHIKDPNEFLYLLNLNDFKLLLISTPERDLVRGKDDLGPPANPCHCREWNFQEFENFISIYFNVVSHTITNEKQGTQLIVCTKKDK